MGLFWSFWVALLCLGAHHAWAQTDKYFVVGQTLVLEPAETPTPITGVEWRHNNDIAAEWTSQAGFESYRNFKGRTALDQSTGVLTITDMTEKEAGTYTVEINSKQQTVQYAARAIEEITNVDLWIRPKGNISEMTCGTNVKNPGPVTYWFDTFGNGSWFQWESKIDLVQNMTTKDWKTVRCKIRNPVGEKISEPKPNPYYEEPTNPVAIVLPVLVIALGLAVGGFFAYKKGLFKRCFSNGRVDVPTDPATETALKDGEGNNA